MLVIAARSSAARLRETTAARPRSPRPTPTSATSRQRAEAAGVTSVSLRLAAAPPCRGLSATCAVERGATGFPAARAAFQTMPTSTGSRQTPPAGRDVRCSEVATPFASEPTFLFDGEPRAHVVPRLINLSAALFVGECPCILSTQSTVATRGWVGCVPHSVDEGAPRGGPCVCDVGRRPYAPAPRHVYAPETGAHTPLYDTVRYRRTRATIFLLSLQCASTNSLLHPQIGMQAHPCTTRCQVRCTRNG